MRRRDEIEMGLGAVRHGLGCRHLGRHAHGDQPLWTWDNDAREVQAQAIPASIWKTKIRTHGLSDVYVVDNKLAPVDPNTGAVANTGWHSHPGPSLIFVVGGTVTNYTSEDRNCTGQKYSAGQGFIDSGKDVHILRNEGSVLAETIAVQLLAANTPSRRIDQPSPGNCPF
jgi:hypothetical protein